MSGARYTEPSQTRKLDQGSIDCASSVHQGFQFRSSRSPERVNETEVVFF
jgi:hypothetical protein